MGASHVVSGDASRARDGTCSRGSLRNDGVIKQGMIVEDDCDDNYLARASGAGNCVVRGCLSAKNPILF